MRKKNRTKQFKKNYVSRRSFVKKAGAASLGFGMFRHASAKPNSITPKLLPEVQMQFMRPKQLETAINNFPVAFVPFGPVEWHGRHLPLGTDALKAHGILVKTAEQFGGAVYPPVYFHEGFGQELMVPVLTKLFQKLRNSGFRVILGVSGHNVQGQIDMINTALEPVVKDGKVAGLGLWEITLSKGAESGTDHAAKWETSDMMYFYPELVDMSTLGDGPLAPKMQPPDGIGGLDPREHASSEAGRRNVELASKAIGEKAKELLEAIQNNDGTSKPVNISPGNWWMI